MKLAFEKWQGLGNDFVIVSGDDLGESLARRLCDRRRGVGGDGVLCVSEEGLREEGLKGESATGARMIVRNADGSRPEMCGNGLRCVVAWLATKRGTARGELTIATDAGPRRCRFEREGAASYAVGVDMGLAVVAPFFHEASAGRDFVHVDVGNPHVVSFDAFADEELDLVGPALERGVRGGVNVELARQVAERRLVTIVWERGVGRTAACGTGACAVGVAAATRGLVPFDAPIEVELPGGVLTITVRGADLAVDMLGPAVHAFTGVVEL